MVFLLLSFLRNFKYLTFKSFSVKKKWKRHLRSGLPAATGRSGSPTMRDAGAGLDGSAAGQYKKREGRFLERKRYDHQV
jgi:hypothetical protein